jgi:hypothetical protein
MKRYTRSRARPAPRSPAIGRDARAFLFHLVPRSLAPGSGGRSAPC